ncbi:MAG: hypothetical protein ACT4P3_09690 [Betaproteobacteria bacterium]
MRFLRRLAVVAASCAAAGCAAPGPYSAHLGSASPALRECAAWYQALDREVDAAGVRDAQYARVAGFPYLRADRMAAAMRARAASSEPLLQAHVQRMLELDLESRRFEIENLTAGQRPALLRRARDCAALLRDADLASPEARAQLLERSRVPDDYSTPRRVLGLYWLTRLPFAAGVRAWERGRMEAFAAGPAEGSRVRYAPPGSTTLARETVAGLLARANLDPLGQPALSGSELELLAAAYAPSFDLASGGDYARFGELRWRRGAATPEVDAAQAAVYILPAATRYGERVLLQLVYMIWFPERPASGMFDLLSGKLDGLVWRVTLAPDGEPLVYDSIHPCGCYHQFFPTPRARPRPAPGPLEEWALVPQSLPRLGDGERPVVSVASGTHYIERVAVVRGPDSVVRYAFRPYDELRSLQRMDGGRRSAFGPDGLIAGTERAERFFFWPMGIASSGAMRQWGRHATAFVGRRHFDDADLIERRFELDLGEAGK